MMIRCISLSLVSWVGFAGLATAAEPQLKYPFAVVPVEAIARLEQLRDPQAPPSNQPCAAEYALIERVAVGGPLTEIELAEAVLLASGGTDEAPRRIHHGQLDDLTRDARAAVASSRSDREQADRLLAFLRAGVMSAGPEATQSSVIGILNHGKFNGLSGTALYRLVGARMGLDSQLLRAAAEPVFGAIKPMGSQKSEELSLALALYQQRAVENASQGEHLDGAILRFTMLALAPESRELQDHSLNALTDWIAALEAGKRYTTAIEVGRIGLEIAPAHRRLSACVQSVSLKLATR